MKIGSLASRYPVALFFAGSLFAWIIWGSQAAFRHGYIAWAPSLQSPLNALTVWSPGLAALILSRAALGKGGAAALFRGLVLWRVPPVWYLFALLFEPAKWLVALGIDRALGRSYELQGVPLFQYLGPGAAFMVPVALVFTLPNSLGEELGWRAYALPNLQARHGALVASLLLGLFWGFWHLPMWATWAKGGLTVAALALMWASMVPAAVLYTWLYNQTGRSLLLVCVLHASAASKGYLLPRLSSTTEMFVLWFVAVLVVTLGGLKDEPSGEPAAAVHGEKEPE